jgi:hypothetical protein
MTSSDGIHPFAIEHAPDGLYYLHTDRAPNKWSVAFDVNRQPQGFATEQEARDFAKEQFGAGDSDFATHPMAR